MRVWGMRVWGYEIMRVWGVRVWGVSIFLKKVLLFLWNLLGCGVI